MKATISRARRFNNGTVEATARVRLTVTDDRVQIALAGPKRAKRPIEVQWSPKPKSSVQIHHARSGDEADPKLIRAIARAHGWLDQLSAGTHASIDALAATAKYNPKVIRQGLRLAFLAPELAEAAIAGSASFKLPQIPKALPLAWSAQPKSIG